MRGTTYEGVKMGFDEDLNGFFEVFSGGCVVEHNGN